MIPGTGSHTTHSDGVPRIDEVARQFDELVSRILSARLPEYDAYLYVYNKSLEKPGAARRYVRQKLDQLALARVRPENNAVLDVGCGFGLTLVVYGLLGAAELHGIEVQERMVRTARAYAPLLPETISSRLDVRVGDAAALPYDDQTFDILLSNEAISHYRDVDEFLREAGRVLRRGGVLIISDGNNGLNPLVRWRAHEIWEAFERGPAGAHVHGHAIGTPFSAARGEILRSAFPDMDPQVREQLAQQTSGMVQQEVVAAAEEYLRTKRVPASRYERGVVPTDPISTQVMERVFDPFELGRRIQSHGFSVKVRGYWGGAGGQPAVRGVNAVLSAMSPVTMRSARGFRIAAIRK